MSTSIGYAAAGVIVAASAITATLATFGLGGETAAIAVATAGATAGVEQALVTTPGGSTIPLAPGEQITSTEVVQTPAGPVEYVYVAPAPAPALAPALAPARGGDDDDDEHEGREGSRDHDDDDDDDDDDEHDKREDRRESRSTSRGDRR